MSRRRPPATTRTRSGTSLRTQRRRRTAPLAEGSEQKAEGRGAFRSPPANCQPPTANPMTLTRPTPLLLLAAAAAFAAALALFAATNPATRDLRPATPLARSTDAQIAALQSVVRSHP